MSRGAASCVTVLSGQPAGELLLRLGVEADSAEGGEGVDPGAHLGLCELGVLAAGGREESAESVPLGGYGG